MIKIMFHDKRIFLTKNAKEFISTYKIDNVQLVFNCNQESILKSLDFLLISSFKNIIFEGDENELLAIFKISLYFQQAAGGVVENNRNEILFIYRNKKWDFAKGKLELDESIEQCAIREVKEETGIANIKLLSFIDCTYHIYIESKYILKETHWYLMESEDRMLYPQKEEGIKKVVWIHKNNIDIQLKNTYESVKDLLQILHKKRGSLARTSN